MFDWAWQEEVPWGPNGEPGGHRFALLQKFRLVRGTKRHRLRVAEANSPLVTEAVNRIPER